MLIRRKNKFALALVLCAALFTQACFFGLLGGGDADQTLLWSHRVVGYTDTARQVILDLYCEACETHQVSRETSLGGLRALQKLHATHAQIYELIRAGLNTEQDQVTLTPENRAKAEALALGLNDSVQALPNVIGAAGARWSAITAPLRDAVQKLADGIGKTKTSKHAGAITFDISRAQLQQFNDQYAALQAAQEELAVCLP